MTTTRYIDDIPKSDDDNNADNDADNQGEDCVEDEEEEEAEEEGNSVDLEGCDTNHPCVRKVAPRGCLIRMTSREVIPSLCHCRVKITQILFGLLVNISH